MAIIPKRLTKEIYSDVPKTLALNPVNDDIIRNTNVVAVKESLKNLILTNRGERLFQPDIGCNVRSLLFDLLTPDLVIVSKQMIKDVISKYEPRVVINDINVLSENNGTLNITLFFNVINIETPITYTITLERVR